MEAVERARRVGNPALSAGAFYAAAAIWPGEPQTALALIEDSLAMTRAGAFDPALGIALSLASAIRAQNGDLPGALAALDESAMQQHADRSGLGLGVTLRIAVALLAGPAKPNRPRCSLEPPRRISRPLATFTQMSGSIWTKVCSPSARRSARPPPAPRRDG